MVYPADAYARQLLRRRTGRSQEGLCGGLPVEHSDLALLDSGDVEFSKMDLILHTQLLRKSDEHLLKGFGLGTIIGLLLWIPIIGIVIWIR